MIWCSLRDRDQAFHHLAEGYREHSSFLINLAVDPIYDPLRRDYRPGPPRRLAYGRRLDPRTGRTIACSG